MRAPLAVVLFVWTGTSMFSGGVIRTFARRMRRNLLWSVAAILWITYIAARIL